MPTTQEETKLISSILDSGLSINNWYYKKDPIGEKAAISHIEQIKAKLTRELAEKVGFLTDNYSVRKSLFDLCRHYNPDWRIPENIIANLIGQWCEIKRDYQINIWEFVGMSEEEWNLHCQGKYQCF